MIARPSVCFLQVHVPNGLIVTLIKRAHRKRRSLRVEPIIASPINRKVKCALPRSNSFRPPTRILVTKSMQQIDLEFVIHYISLVRQQELGEGTDLGSETRVLSRQPD